MFYKRKRPPLWRRSFSKLVLVTCEREVRVGVLPAMLRSVPRLGALILIQVACIRRIALHGVDVEPKLLSRLFVERRHDLEGTDCGAVGVLKDGSILFGVAKLRFALSDSNHNRRIGKVLFNIFAHTLCLRHDVGLCRRDCRRI